MDNDVQNVGDIVSWLESAGLSGFAVVLLLVVLLTYGVISSPTRTKNAATLMDAIRGFIAGIIAAFRREAPNDSRSVRTTNRTNQAAPPSADEVLVPVAPTTTPKRAKKTKSTK
jgi:hypothetical protein